MQNKLIHIRSDIHNAINNKNPVVALESSLISHGLPYPQNIEVAQKSIKAVEDSGSIAATIAIIKGKIKVGLSNEDIDILAKENNIEKVSTHNLAITTAQLRNGATTVASTIMIANKIGIKFMATGGIGGVHINAEKTFDISADINELSNTNMNVVCSGAKSILDLDKTYEILETFGITRIGYKTNFMPGFYYQSTNLKVDFNAKNISELKNIIKNKNILKQKSSTLIFNPVQKINAIKKSLIDKWIKESIAIANSKNILGRNLTPFLISSINELSKGRSLKTNISLIIDNARLASKIASA